MSNWFRWISLGLITGLLLAVAPVASGGGDQDQIVTASWTPDCGGYIVETLADLITSCLTPPPGWSPWDVTQYAVAGNGSIVISGEEGLGDTAPVMLVRSNEQSLELDSSPDDFSPSISYDGSKVAFARQDFATGSSSIYLVNSDGSGLKRVATGGATHVLSSPVLSPDGGSIAYTCQPTSAEDFTSRGCGPLTDGTYRNRGIMLVNADGSHKRKIIIGDNFDPIGEQLSWSPDGKWLAQTGAGGAQVFAYHTDGSDLFNLEDPSRQITHETKPGGAAYPQFSPDGKQILFLKTVDDSGTQGNFAYLINRDGTNRHQVFLSPDPLTCTSAGCSGHPELGKYLPPPSGGGPSATVKATLITVPAVRNLGYRQARRRLLRAHLRVGQLTRRFSRVPRDHVISQYPRAGTRAHRSTSQGPPVQLTLSRGPRHS